MKRSITALVLVSILLGSAQAGEQSWTSSRGLFEIAYTSELEPPEINVLHSWVLHLEDAGGEPVLGAAINVSGGMPAHDHGLATRPRVTAELGGGLYQLDGLRFHMRGEWELTFTIEAEGRTDSVKVILVL